jgi:hypothetical protein
MRPSTSGLEGRQEVLIRASYNPILVPDGRPFKNMQSAAEAVRSISQNMTQIAEATKAAEASTREVKEASQVLAA